MILTKKIDIKDTRNQLILFIGLLILSIVSIIFVGSKTIQFFQLLIILLFLILFSLRAPYLFIFILIILITNIFGIYDIRQEYRIPGLGKPSDFVLLYLVFLSFIYYLGRKNLLIQNENKFNKIVIFILLYMTFIVFYSSYITYRTSFNYALRTGAQYFYYVSFFFPIVLIRKKSDINSYINFLRLGGLITGSIAIASNILGYSFVAGAMSKGYGSYIRVYLPLFFNYFVVVFWTIEKLHGRKSKIKIKFLEMLINLFGILLFLGRTSILNLLLMIFFVFIYLKGFKHFNKIAIVLLVFIFSMILLEYFGLSTSLFFERFQQGYYNTLHGKSTLTGRTEAIALGYNVFKKMPFFGTGFIRPDTDFYKSFLLNSRGYAITNNADFGLASILFTTGIIGFLLITYFVIKLLKYIKQKINIMKKEKEYDLVFTYSLTIFTLTLFVYFFEQLVGNVFGSRMVALYIISLSIDIKILSKRYKT